MPTKKKWKIEEVLDNAIQLTGEGIAWFEGKDPDHELRVGYKSGPVDAEDYMLAGQLLSVYVANVVKLAKEVREARDPNSKANRESVESIADAIAAEMRAHPELRAEVEAKLADGGAVH